MGFFCEKIENGVFWNSSLRKWGLRNWQEKSKMNPNFAEDLWKTLVEYSLQCCCGRRLQSFSTTNFKARESLKARYFQVLWSFSSVLELYVKRCAWRDPDSLLEKERNSNHSSNSFCLKSEKFDRFFAKERENQTIFDNSKFLAKFIVLGIYV